MNIYQQVDPMLVFFYMKRFKLNFDNMSPEQAFKMSKILNANLLISGDITRTKDKITIELDFYDLNKNHHKQIQDNYSSVSKIDEITESLIMQLTKKEAEKQ